MPPQNNQPENIVPGIPPETPEIPVAPPTFGDVLASQNAEAAGVENQAAIVPTEVVKPEVALVEAAPQLPSVEAVQSMPASVTTETAANTPKELVQKFELIEKMADDPHAEQEAFKKAQSEYLASLGEDIEKTA